MTYEEFLDEIKKIEYSCPHGLIMNTKTGVWGDDMVVPRLHICYSGVRGPVSFEDCIKYYKLWAKEINEEHIKKYKLHYTHEEMVKDAEERFKLEKENPGKSICRDSKRWRLVNLKL